MKTEQRHERRPVVTGDGSQCPDQGNVNRRIPSKMVAIAQQPIAFEELRVITRRGERGDVARVSRQNHMRRTAADLCELKQHAEQNEYTDDDTVDWRYCARGLAVRRRIVLQSIPSEREPTVQRLTGLRGSCKKAIYATQEEVPEVQRLTELRGSCKAHSKEHPPTRGQENERGDVDGAHTQAIGRKELLSSRNELSHR